jgi:hypothetical protein
MNRLVEPELLDSLPADDPAARRSRGDLLRINTIMRQQAAMAALLRTVPQPRTLIDLGSGDGRFLLGVARRLPWKGVRLIVADRQDIMSEDTERGFASLGWRSHTMQGDIFKTLQAIPPARMPRFPQSNPPLPHREEPGERRKTPVIVTANLFLHHFADAYLKRLLLLAESRAGVFAACEPYRSPFALKAAKLVGLIGANKVTRHDAVASVRAGFAGKELTALWPQQGWTCTEEKRFLFTHCFLAKRIEP